MISSKEVLKSTISPIKNIPNRRKKAPIPETRFAKLFQIRIPSIPLWDRAKKQIYERRSPRGTFRVANGAFIRRKRNESETRTTGKKNPPNPKIS